MELKLFKELSIRLKPPQCCLSTLNLTKDQISQERAYMQGIPLAWISKS